MAMLRTEAVAELARVRGSMLTIVTMQPIAPWTACGQADERNLNLLGSMGSAGAIGLGLALARPNDGVMVLDGDGSLVMQLGTLVSVGSLRPSNLYHVVFENGTYETSGRQPVPGHDVADLCALARASGYVDAVRYSTAAEMADLPRVLAAPGPVLISLVISGQGGVPETDAPKPPPFVDQLEIMRLALARTAA